MNKKHDELREILQRSGAKEYGDILIDEICELFDYPKTIDIAAEFGNELKTDTYRKLVSRTPDQYTDLDEKQAFFNYMYYLSLFDDMLQAKSFKQWLESAI